MNIEQQQRQGGRRCIVSRFLAFLTRPNAGNWSLLNSAFYGVGMMATAALIIAAHVSGAGS